MYAKIKDQTTKEVIVGSGTNISFYKSLGMTEMDVEQSYDGKWYVAGYAPSKPEPSKEEKLAKLDSDYSAQKQELANEYTDALIHADTDAQELVQQEMTELDEWYDEEYRKIEEETEGE
jgi:hypothetical protein